MPISFKSFSPSPPVPLWSQSKPLLPFSVGLSLELTEHQAPQQSLLPHYPSVSHHHQEVPIYHEHHHQKPGVCPEPDRDYYNRPGYYQDYFDEIPKGIV